MDIKNNIITVEELEQNIDIKKNEISEFCKEQGAGEISFFSFETLLVGHIAKIACLYFQLFVLVRHERLDYRSWLDSGLYYLKHTPIFRTVKTIYGPVRIYRKYLEGKTGGMIFPFDISLGLTKDSFSPMVMNIATKLSTRVSFATAVIIFKCFCKWSPSAKSIEELALGLGAEASAYMEEYSYCEKKGDVLVIEVDGKATPTATEDELKKRRRKRPKMEKICCQRHRGRGKRKRFTRKGRKKGDKSKNGKSITLVVMYTLKRGDDGFLHGPYDKIVWASYAPRHVMLEWAKTHAKKRGFSPCCDKNIHIAVDGEVCLKKGLSKLFPHATFVLDIRHLEEKIWKVGRRFYEEGNEELEKWVEKQRELIYQGKVNQLLKNLKIKASKLSKRAKRDEEKLKSINNLISYIEKRLDMMNYKKYIDEDLPIGTGIVEGAVRYVISERMDCSGMRWIQERAEALLRLRCIELNGDWDEFFNWGYDRWIKKLKKKKKFGLEQQNLLIYQGIQERCVTEMIRNYLDILFIFIFGNKGTAPN